MGMLILRSLSESENQRRRTFRASRRANEHDGQKQGQAKQLLLYNTLKEITKNQRRNSFQL